MKFNSAISKLMKSGYKIENTDSLFYIATKLGKKISFSLHKENPRDAQTLKEIRYNSGSGKWKRARNLTHALQQLGDVFSSSREEKIAGFGKTTRESLVKLFVNTGRLSSAQLNSLKILTYYDVNEIFNNAFKLEFENFRYSLKKSAKQRELARKKMDLWSALIDNFLSNSENTPLRSVEISTAVPGFENIEVQHSGQLNTKVKTRVPIFARTPEGASALVKSILGDLASVTDAGVVAIGSQNEAIGAYRKIAGRLGREVEEAGLKQARSRYKDLESKFEFAKKEVELSEKKLELITFLENFSTMATISSQGGSIESLSCDKIFEKV